MKKLLVAGGVLMAGALAANVVMDVRSFRFGGGKELMRCV